jgi:hypothetical protein
VDDGSRTPCDKASGAAPLRHPSPVGRCKRAAHRYRLLVMPSRRADTLLGWLDRARWPMRVRVSSPAPASLCEFG